MTGPASTPSALGTPAVTVLMSVYNGLPDVNDAIESILRQAFRDFELLVIDDGSTDGTAATLDRLARADGRLRVIHQENRGLSRSLDRGLREARGALIARQDADDTSDPRRLERQAAYLDAHPGVVLVGTGAHVLDAEGQPLWDAAVETVDATLRTMLRSTSPFFHGSVMFRREAALAAGGYRPEPHVEDILLWRALAKHGSLANLPEPLYSFRLSPTGQNNVTRPIAARKRRILESLAAAGDGAFPPEDLAFLEGISGRLDGRTRRFQYHLNLARGLVRRELHGRRGRAVREALRAARMRPWAPEPYFVLALACLPQRLRRAWFARRERVVGRPA